MAKKTVFVSFDYDDNKNYKLLLLAWDANKNFEFSFSDRSSGEIYSSNIGQVKAALTRKIKSAKRTLVIVGENANKKHKDSKLIGYRNWIDFEIAKSVECGNKLIGVKIDRSYKSPEELLDNDASWAMSFKEESIIKALNDS